MAQEPSFGPSANFSCYIHVYNKSNIDFSLSDSKAVSGSWREGSPPNTISAESEVLIDLKDPFRSEGSEGWVVYEFNHPKRPEKPVSFKLEFSDPYGASNPNKLTASTSTPLLISCKVLSYETEGHPFVGHVEIYVPDVSAAEQEEFQAPETAKFNDQKLHAEFDIGFKAIGGLLRKKPIHEDLTIAAFIMAKPSVRFPKGTCYNNLDRGQWEYMRGLIWNDDPSCFLFEDNEESNTVFADGTEWARSFLNGPPSCLTQRSHFGDLQFLHSMASGDNEDANTTKANLLGWLEVMYKLAIGIDGVNETDRLDSRFPTRFSGSSDPSGDKNLRDLILGSKKSYRKIDIRKRALGSCLHAVQDSHAVGHTLRRLLNPADLDGKDDKGFPRFKPGTYAQLGPIITFHNYDGQSDRHKHFDSSKTEITPKDLSSFNNLIGARDAIEKSKTLIDFYVAKTKWDDGVSKFLADVVFALDEKVTRSNAEVDEHFGLPQTSGTMALVELLEDRNEDLEYSLGFERKLAMLEGGLAHAQGVPTTTRTVRCLQMLRPSGRVILTISKYIMAFIGVLLMFILAQLATRTLNLY